jgi:uncharacterized protein (TIGR03086 family)
MSDVSAVWRRVAGAFTDRVETVAPEAWDSPSPCEGWVARDIVRHLTEWVPAFLAAGAAIEAQPGPSVDDDPAAAWRHLREAIESILDAPDATSRRFEHPQAGSHARDDAIAQFVLGDVLIHTWDLARATGQDETLDAELVTTMLAGMEPMADILAASGHYGPRIPAPDDADEQTKLIALSGRRP